MLSFKRNEMYKNLYKDVDMAFMVKNIVFKDKNVTTLNVDWYKKTEYGKYITIGVTGDFDIPKSQEPYFVKV